MSNEVKQVYSNGAYTAQRVMNQEGQVDHGVGSLWSIDALFPDEHHVCDIRGEANAIQFLQSIVDSKRGLQG